ncbi:MAG: hypothetical protein AB8B47_12320 [Roseobacter sp.]
MNGFTKKVAAAAVVVAALGVGFGGQAQAGSDFGKVLLGAVALGVIANKVDSDRERARVVTQSRNNKVFSVEPRVHNRHKKLKRYKYTSKKFHKHGKFGHVHRYSRIHSH